MRSPASREKSASDGIVVTVQGYAIHTGSHPHVKLTRPRHPRSLLPLSFGHGSPRSRDTLHRCDGREAVRGWHSRERRHGRWARRGGQVRRSDPERLPLFDRVRRDAGPRVRRVAGRGDREPDLGMRFLVDLNLSPRWIES